MDIKEKISALLEELNSGIYEKEEVIRLALLSAVAGESIFLLGPPGTAKSLIARRLKYAFERKPKEAKDGKEAKEAAVFEYLMSRFSTPDEIFGPVAISKLKEDKYERVVEGYLPAAEVVFLDEIWKAGPSIQNALLTIVNEKIFRNGEAEIKVPMKALISASNELPAEGEGLEALWDRFLVRLVVEGIENREIFNKMISEDTDLYNDTVSAENKITDAEYSDWNEYINKVDIPENVFNVIYVIRHKIAEYNQPSQDGESPESLMYVSDRRWRKIVRLLRTSAFLNGRKEVDLMDCFLIKHCIWDDEAQIDTAHQFVRDAIEQHGFKLNFSIIRDGLGQLWQNVQQETRVSKTETIPKLDEDGYYTVSQSRHSDLSGHKITKTDFDSLNKDEISVQFNDDSSYPSYSRTIKASKNPCCFVYQGETIYLETELSEKWFSKIPGTSDKATWEQQVNTVFLFLDESTTKIAKFREQNRNMKDNLFVDAGRSESVV
jgi:MoxR-like ATPase